MRSQKWNLPSSKTLYGGFVMAAFKLNLKFSRSTSIHQTVNWNEQTDFNVNYDRNTESGKAASWLKSI